jgi:hypothetical protein
MKAKRRAMTIKRVRLQVRMNGLTKDDPPLLAYSKMLTRPDGKRKLCSQMAQVTDAGLLARLRKVEIGDEIEVEVAQRIGEGNVLLDFSAIGARLPVQAQTSA